MRSLSGFVLGLGLIVSSGTAYADANGPTLVPNLAGKFQVTGQSQMVSPSLVKQWVPAKDCSTLHAVRGATVGGMPLTVTYPADPDPKSPGCLSTILLDGKPLPDSNPTHLGTDGFNGFSEGVYVIGANPYALLIVTANDVSGADHNGDYTMTLYVVRNGKPLEVFLADSKDVLDASVKNNTLFLSNVYRMHGDECMACSVEETMSFDIDPTAGRVHWHAPTPRATESVEYWLNEADPAFRANEEANAKAELAQDENNENDYPITAPQPATVSTPSHWWIYSYWAKQCASTEITPKNTYDAENDSGEGPVVDRIDQNHVRIGYPDPQNPNLVDYNDFFRTSDSCQDFANDLATQNSDLN
jgi:hypothetical protein